MKLHINIDKPNSNTEMVAAMMEFSEYGPLAQIFVVHAITKAAEQIASIPVEKITEQMAESMVSPDAWRGVAVEIKEKMEKFYNRHNKGGRNEHQQS